MEARVTEQTLSHYPSHSPPFPVRLVVTPTHACSYFDDRTARTRAFWASALPGELYHQFMDAGFRRSGRLIYQPVCDRCRDCIPIRVPVERFAPSKSQRRCWRKNQDLSVNTCVPQPTAEKRDLYERYRRDWHGNQDGQDWEAFTSFLYDSPVNTTEFCYRDPQGRLLGVGICDLCSQSLSSVYFYFDPDHAKRRLGTFAALWEIDFARRHAIEHYYMGYWVGGCGAMEYKSSFRPCELLGTDGVWREAPRDHLPGLETVSINRT
jgi:arginyl-tRNA--protein-N-Asp/Glu arginylyltransferase